MPSLLSIPPELVDRIIEIVILTERTPPADVTTAEQNRTPYKSKGWNSNDFPRSCRSWRYGPQHVRYEKTETRANITGLLLSNRQLRQQTASALCRIYPDGLTYKLDCIFLNEREILPTWTHVPAASKRIRRVNVTFRIFGTNTEEGYSAFAGGCGGPMQIVWTFYYLLEHFLEYGTTSSSPLTKKWSENPENCVVINNINLNFTSGEPDKPVQVDTPENSRAWYASQRYRSASPENDASSLPMHPRWLAEKVSSELQTTVSIGYNTAEFASDIFERVGTFAVSSESIIIYGLDVGQALARQDYRPDAGHDCYTTNTFGHLPGQCRILTFWNWKYRAVQLRKQLGLPMEEAIIVWPMLEDMQHWRAGAKKERRKARQPGYSSSKCDSSLCMCRHRGLEDMLKGRTSSLV